jgi:hypothetical protein
VYALQGGISGMIRQLEKQADADSGRPTES